NRRGNRLGGATLGVAQLRAAELGIANLFGTCTQRGDRRNDFERRLPRAKSVGLLGDDRLGALGLAAPARQSLRDHRFEVVDVVEVATVELVDRRFEVARHGEVDQEKRPASACRQRSLHLFAREDPAPRARRRDDYISTRKLILDARKRQGLAAETFRELLRALARAVGHERNRGAPRDEIPDRKLTCLARADDEDAAVA